ncbi:MAG: MotA/TolQ/ExbB proton channel family protein [Gammaproteobacteria bacterium]|nr:MotA/TolQ/ExbB proton channel family protein [Gammaproteobacteria bacterium]
MNKHNPLSDFLYQFFALLLSLIIVHTLYVTLVRPNAAEIINKQNIQQASGEVVEVKRSLYIVIKDFEQEACFVLALWVFAIMALKAKTILREGALLTRTFINISPGTSLLPEDTKEYSRALQSLDKHEQEYLLPRTLLAGLQRFGSTKNIQDVATSIKETCELESDRLDSELSMVRYIIWAIPSIGFIGTVRGIGEALGQAHKAVEGDILGVTLSLGVAFNSTFVALIISIFIMFLMHQLQLLQERLVLNTQNYCDVNLIRHLKMR